MNFLNQIRKPKLSDIELIAVDLTSEFMGIDLEYQLFRILPDYFREKIERRVYNRRKRRLFFYRNQLRKRIVCELTSDIDYYIVDSMPLEVAKLSRSSRSSICKEAPGTAPNKGYCASQKLYYYSYKLQAVCTFDGFKNRVLSKMMTLAVIQFINKLSNKNINNSKTSIA